MVDLSIASWDVASRFTTIFMVMITPILLLQAVEPQSTASSIAKVDWNGFSRNIRRQLSGGHGVLTLSVWVGYFSPAHHILKEGGNGELKRVPVWQTEVNRAIKYLSALRRQASDDPSSQT